jgi:hypothetical protein
MGAVVAGAVLAMPAMAQSPSAGGVRVGILAGVNSATVAGDDDEDVKRSTRMMGGVYLVKDLGRGWAIRPELLYSQKGAKGKEDGVESKLKLDYIDLPVLLQYEPTGTSEARPHVYVGPSFGFNVQCELEGSEGGLDVTVDCDDFDSDVKSLDVGGIIGAGMSFPLGGLRGMLGGRYQHGFTDVFGDSDGGSKNRVFSVVFGVEFGKK